MEVSGSTVLFGDCASERLKMNRIPYTMEYQEIIDTWALKTMIRCQPTDSEQVEQTEGSVQGTVPTRRPEILKGSTGSRIFELLGKFNPAAVARPAVRRADPKGESEDARAKRKLAF
jgi:hypothetical protein